LKITAEHVEALSGIYLSQRYDQPQPTPDFHREVWHEYCSDFPQIAFAAPRNHAKSTGFTHDFVIANAVFRVEKYILIIGATEELAIEHLGDIRSEFQENEALRRDFKIKGFIVDQKMDIILECVDGYKFRIIARGAEQRIRGKKWEGCRPGLIVCDDIEEDEQVESKDRRKKLRRWFFRACKQALRDGGRLRIHGTILHQDSLLARLMKNSTWKHKIFKAHRSFTDFTEILWPEKFNEKRLRAIKQEFVDDGDGAGYSQEYLNDPQDNDSVYIRPEDMLSLYDEDRGLDFRDIPRIYYAGMDFAIGQKTVNDKTAIVVGGKGLDNRVAITDVRAGRWDTIKNEHGPDNEETSIIDEMFSVQVRWNIDTWFVEDGIEWKTMKPVLINEMHKRDIFLNIIPMQPVKDKAVRGRPYQKRSKAGAVLYDTEASWFKEYQEEILLFKAETEALHDDQFDATAWLFKGIEISAQVDKEDFYTEEEEEYYDEQARQEQLRGRSTVTGY
jgi:predicted phage terminase large subunit-like protein